MTPFECFLLNDSPAIWGNPDLQLKECFGLHPGTTITKLGAPGKFGKETSDNRIKRFDPPVVYSGLITANTVKPGYYDHSDIYAAFKIPESILPNRIFSPLGNLYMLFLVMDHGYLWQEKIKSQVVHTFPAVFEINKPN